MYGMNHKDRNSHKEQNKKRSGQAWLVYVQDIIHNIPAANYRDVHLQNPPALETRCHRQNSEDKNPPVSQIQTCMNTSPDDSATLTDNNHLFCGKDLHRLLLKFIRASENCLKIAMFTGGILMSYAVKRHPNLCQHCKGKQVSK